MASKLKLPGTNLSISVTNNSEVIVDDNNKPSEDTQSVQEEFIKVDTQLDRDISVEDRSPCNWTIESNSKSVVKAYSISGNKFYGNKSEFSKIFLTS